jgi:PASTA domain
MKKIFLCLSLLALCGAAYSNPLPMPPGYPTLLGASCGGVHVTTAIVSINDDSTISGEVYAWTRCSTGGRGSKPRLIQAYHSITWDFFGNYLVRAYDGGALDTRVVATDSYGNTAYSLNGVAQLDVHQVPPNAVAIAAHAPALIGLTQADAIARVTAAGLVTVIVASCQNAYPNAGTVFNQNPAAGQTLPYGSTVTLYVTLGTVAACDEAD